MRFLFSYIFILFSFKTYYSQYDTLVFKNGLETGVRIDKRGLHNVFVIVKENGRDNIIKIKNKQIDYIKLGNGDEEFVDSYWNRKYEIFGRNFFDVDLLGLKYSSFGFSFQRLSESGKIAIKMPLGFHLDNGQYMNYRNLDYPNKFAKFTSGFNLNIYPFGQKIVTYYFGFAINYSLVDIINPNYGVKFIDYSPKEYFRYDQFFLKNTHTLALCFQSGILFRITKNIYANAEIGAGPSAYFVPVFRTLGFQLYGHFNIGWEF